MGGVPGCLTSRGSRHGSLPDQGLPWTPHVCFSGSEVVVKHFGNGVLLLPIDDPWQTLEAGLATFEPGFVITREQPEGRSGK